MLSVRVTETDILGGEHDPATMFSLETLIPGEYVIRVVALENSDLTCNTEWRHSDGRACANDDYRAGVAGRSYSWGIVWPAPSRRDICVIQLRRLKWARPVGQTKQKKS
jgi:hypothetical protein